MRTTMAFLVSLSCLITAPAYSFAEKSPADAIMADIVERESKVVGVLPSVISRRGNNESTVGELGPRGKLMAREIYKKLVDASRAGIHKGKYKVVSERAMARAMETESFTVEDLADPKKVRDLCREAGIDDLVVLTHDESTNGADVSLADSESGQQSEHRFVTIDRITAETLDDEGFASSAQDFEDGRTLSKSAYSGDSWWIRKWEDGKLVNIGIDLEEKYPFGKGVRWERAQYRKLKSGLQHPYNEAGFPYRVEVLVDGKVRAPHPVPGVHGKQLVVALEPGEIYQVRLENDTDRGVFCALYIDGVNSVDKDNGLVEPEDLETMRHWYLPANSGLRTIKGWHEIKRGKGGDPEGTQFYNEFKIVDKKDSVAFGKGFEENIGMITAIFYTDGMDDIEQPDDKDLDKIGARGLPPAEFGTGLGDKKDQKLEFYGDKQRGIILAAYTLYYRTGDQVANLRSGDTEGDLPFQPMDEIASTDPPEAAEDPSDDKVKKGESSLID